MIVLDDVIFGITSTNLGIRHSWKALHQYKDAEKKYKLQTFDSRKVDFIFILFILTDFAVSCCLKACFYLIESQSGQTEDQQNKEIEISKKILPKNLYLNYVKYLG